MLQRWAGCSAGPSLPAAALQRLAGKLLFLLLRAPQGACSCVPAPHCFCLPLSLSLPASQGCELPASRPPLLPAHTRGAAADPDPGVAGGVGQAAPELHRRVRRAGPAVQPDRLLVAQLLLRWVAGLGLGWAGLGFGAGRRPPSVMPWAVSGEQQDRRTPPQPAPHLPLQCCASTSLASMGAPWSWGLMCPPMWRLPGRRYTSTASSPRHVWLGSGWGHPPGGARLASRPRMPLQGGIWPFLRCSPGF